MESYQQSHKNPNAIVVRRGYYNYGATRVLQNLNMTVKRGNIYGLLGASGCGKTTLLSCLVGRRQLHSGKIRVLGVKPGTKGSGIPGKRIGYMPQEIALYLNFTIKELVKYFGWIFGMSSESIEQRVKELMTLVDMPNEEQIVKNMSGGQQRRVSFAVALLHDPEILILDEPTAGMDAVLKHAIWEHLLQLASCRNVTIIVTTHYIEEARKATMIGLMRNGRLLDEDSPEALLRKNGCESLEGVFLQLSAIQQETKTMPAELVPAHLDQKKHEPQSLLPIAWVEQEEHKKSFAKDCCSLISKGTMKALLFKNIICIFRDTACMLYQYGLCLLAVSCVYLSFGFEPTGLHLAVVNEDRSALDPRCSSARPGMRTCNFTDLSCRYLAHLKEPTILKDFYNSTQLAIEAVRGGRAWGALHFGENFTEVLAGRLFVDPLDKNLNFVQGYVQVQLDMSNQVIGLAILEEIKESYLEFTENLLSSCGYNIKLAKIPLRINDPVYGSKRPTFISFVAPGILIVMMMFFGVALTVWTFTQERREGLFNRNFVAGVTTFEIMFSYFLVLSMLMMSQVALMVVFGIFVYHFQCIGSVALVVAFIMIQGINGMFFGFLISACCERENMAAFLSVGSLIPMLVLSGIVWPLEGMQSLVRMISKLLPLTLPIRGIRAVMCRGSTLQDVEVYSGLLVSAAWLGVLIVACSLTLRVNKL